jgi:FtsP/CotA-like multicopper oxidase with cupredoxin domain
LSVGPETYDIIVQPHQETAYTIFAQPQSRGRYARGTLAPRAGMTAKIPVMDPYPVRTMADMGMGDMAHMKGMKMDGMPSDQMPGMQMDGMSDASMPAMKDMDMSGMKDGDMSAMSPRFVFGISVRH